MSNTWSTGNFDPDDLNAGPKGRHYPPSKAKLRQMAKDSKEGGRFTCPECKESFSVTYGIFGRAGYFQDATHHCKDCVPTIPNFVRAR
jgi:transposase-like protein